jgi:hypothetical protein
MSGNFLNSLIGLTNEEAVKKITEAGYTAAMGSNSPSPQPPIPQAQPAPTPQGQAVSPMPPVATVAQAPHMKVVNIVVTNNVVTRAYFG